jgi:phage terminase large subunit GpA-like protein
MDALNDPSIREVVFMKSAQVGWTEMLNNVIGYFVHQDPSPIMLMQPTLEMAEAWSKDRLAPMIRDTPVLRDRIADAKARDSGNTLLHKRFNGGHLTITGANSPSSLASRPIRVLAADEVDRFPISAGTEGDPIDLARKRTTTFWNRKVMLGSTPTIKGASRIEAAFQQSDQRYFFVPCPHCKEFQRLFWAQVRWDDGKPETARYVCSSCGTLLDEQDRRWMIGADPVLDADGNPVICEATGEPLTTPRGEWRGTEPFNGVAGFHLFELYSPFVSMEEMVANFLRAKILPETLKTWVNTALGETWEEKGSTVEAGSLLERREAYGPDLIPEGVLLLTVGGDVQADRVELQLLGWGADEECWLLEQYVLRGDPDKAELWREVDEYLLRRYTTEEGRTLVVEAAAIDSGGHSTQAVYDFVVSRKRRRVFAIKGMAGTGRLAWPKAASRTAKSRAKVFILGVDTIKSTLYGRIGKVPDPGPGYIHLPDSIDEGFLKQLTSEKAITKYVRGRPTVVWEPRSKGIAQEAQDCWVYGYAAMLGRGGGALLTRRSRGMSRGAPPKVDEQEAPQVAAPKPVPAPQTAAPQRSATFTRRGWFRQ